MSNAFYRAFEDKFRGSRETIKERLKFYVPFLSPLAEKYPKGKTLDLGCGRGEWLEILLETGFAPQGYDLDEGMLEACRALGLPAAHGDAIEALKNTPSDSQIVVSGFHIAEHLPFEVLLTLIKEALRVLVPGGILILETPNPENISVATSSFYLDPSHNHPIPPALLAFLPEFCGFKAAKIVRLQEPPALHSQTIYNLTEVLHGVSPDYAIIAVKLGGDQMPAFAEAYAKDYGIDLHGLSSRYATALETRLQKLERRLNTIESNFIWKLYRSLTKLLQFSKQPPK